MFETSDDTIAKIIDETMVEKTIINTFKETIVKTIGETIFKTLDKTKFNTTELPIVKNICRRACSQDYKRD